MPEAPKPFLPLGEQVDQVKLVEVRQALERDGILRYAGVVVESRGYIGTLQDLTTLTDSKHLTHPDFKIRALGLVAAAAKKQSGR